ncbi:tail fiber domain-containing protein, partial [Streptococcus pneumoniae]|nr:tail fiber domain-containing protein [Streptococcus pneumoniae]MDD0792904.1 tail fiber domain-containing protein [Streptococcus pneumoniae]
YRFSSLLNQGYSRIKSKNRKNGENNSMNNNMLTNIALKAIQELALENRKRTHRLENLENEHRTA